jgi:hypothetical protein
VASVGATYSSPGTVLNNQFGGADPWGDYIAALEARSPVIEAIAATDYYVTDTYEQILGYKAANRLPNVDLIFPNIEIRLDVAAKSGFVNVHLRQPGGSGSSRRREAHPHQAAIPCVRR